LFLVIPGADRPLKIHFQIEHFEIASQFVQYSFCIGIKCLPAGKLFAAKGPTAKDLPLK